MEIIKRRKLERFVNIASSLVGNKVITFSPEEMNDFQKKLKAGIERRVK